MKLRTLIIISTLLISITFILYSNAEEIKEIDSSESAINNVIGPEKIIFIYESDFSSSEKIKLEKWLNSTTMAVAKRLGDYPFQVHYYLNRSENAGEPVPWAHTERSDIQGVHFHVNPDFSLEDFLNDWTAPHEISHLAIPFVGKSNSWFAEGFATYMQNEVLLEMNEMTEKQVKDKYDSKLDAAYPYYQKEEPFAEVAMDLRSQHRYPQMYWGGAYFFVQLDKELKKNNGKSLCEVLVEYQDCCRLQDGSIDDIMTSFDQISDGNTSRELINNFRTLPAKEILVIE